MKDFKIDEKQLKFLGEFFSTAAKNAKQYNDFTSLFDFKKSEDNDLMDLFKNFYKLDSSSSDSDKKSNDFSNALDSFQGLMKQYMAMFNFSDNTKIKELEEKCKNLEKELEEKDKEINVLKSIIEQSNNQSELINNFQKVFVDQGKEFQKVMDKFGFFPNSNKKNK
jgi:predicted RNase H-like nuclease (RuvC/YqgF family)